MNFLANKKRNYKYERERRKLAVENGSVPKYIKVNMIQFVFLHMLIFLEMELKRYTTDFNLFFQCPVIYISDFRIKM